MRSKLWFGLLVLPALAAVYYFRPIAPMHSSSGAVLPVVLPDRPDSATEDAVVQEPVDSNVPEALAMLRGQKRELEAQGIFCGIGVGESKDEQIAITMSEDDARAEMAKGKAVLGRTTVHQSITLYNQGTQTHQIYTLMVSKP